MNTLQGLVSELAEFHFLRPEWFWALIPVLLIFLLLKARESSSSSWTSTIDTVLLPFLIEQSGQPVQRNPFYLLLAGWILTIAALAGPAWEKTPQPVHSKEDALIIALDLSFSMYATDVKPNRLTRARQKLLDILDNREEGVTGLIVYAGDAHVVSPLTDDANTIASMVPALSPEIMPIYGSALVPAVHLALDMFKDGNVTNGRILLIADDIPDMASSQQLLQDNRYNFPISILSVGTAEGAPIMLPGQGSLKDSKGVIVIPRLDFSSLQNFAESVGGRFTAMSVQDADLNYLLQETPDLDEEQYRQIERDFDVWHEQGPWLILLLLPLAALAFRRGWLWCLVLVMLFPGTETFAEENLSTETGAAQQLWQDLWQTRNQQAIDAFKNGDSQKAAQMFTDPAWQGSAHYAGGNYPKAEELFGNEKLPENQYNLGNSLARQNKLQDAIAAYDNALETDPDNEDAQFNRDLIEKLMEQQQQQQQNQDQEQNQDQQKNEQNPSDENQQSDQQQNEDQQGDSQQQQDSSQQDQQQQNDQPQESDQQSEQQSEEQQQADAQQQQQTEEERQAAEQQSAEMQEQQLDEEARQSLEQWLRRVPDDPGGLLRRKFEYQAQQRQQQGKGKFTDRNAVW